MDSGCLRRSRFIASACRREWPSSGASSRCPLELLFFVPSVSKVLIGFILFTFFCSLLNVTLGWRKAVFLGLPFVAFAVWDVVFLVSLLHKPDLLPRLTGFLPAIILVNLVYVLAALVMLGLQYRTLTDPTDRRRLRWIVAGSALGCAAGAPTIAGLWIGSNDPTLIYHTPFGVQLVYTAFLVMPRVVLVGDRAG